MRVSIKDGLEGKNFKSILYLYIAGLIIFIPVTSLIVIYRNEKQLLYTIPLFVITIVGFQYYFSYRNKKRSPSKSLRERLRYATHLSGEKRSQVLRAQERHHIYTASQERFLAQALSAGVGQTSAPSDPIARSLYIVTFNTGNFRIDIEKNLEKQSIGPVSAILAGLYHRENTESIASSRSSDFLCNPATSV